MIKFLLIILTLLGHLAAVCQTNLGLRYYLDSDSYSDETISTVYVRGKASDIKIYCAKNHILYRKASQDYHCLTLNKVQLKNLAQTDVVNYIQFSLSQGHVLNDSTRVINNVEPILTGDSSLLQTYSGDGVLVGIIDGGIDFTHRDFQFTDSSTRVLALWKQHESFSATLTPTDFGYGRAYDSTMINAGTVSISGQYVDHGCTVTGAAAGNALANGKHMGMAPNTDLIVVSSDFNMPNWKSSVADAVEYIIDVADSLNKPVVINASLGDYLGSHDGLDPAALRIDSLLLAKPGRLMVAAAGNSGAIGKYHLKTLVTTDTLFTWFKHNTSTAYGFAGNFIEIWGDTAQLNIVDFALSSDKVTGGYSRRGISNFHNLTNALNTIVEDTIWSSSGDNLATVSLYMELRGGQYLMQVAITNPDSSAYNIGLLSTGSGEFDIWSAHWLGTNDMEDILPSITQFPEITNYVLPDTLTTIVDSWACSPHVITVGNYYSRLSYLSYNGTLETVPGTQHELSISSSKGPSRTGLLKPNITATGDMALSAARMSTLLYSQTNDPTKLDVGGLHIRNGGTSMASPIIAGIGALLLEKCPKTTVADFSAALNATAQSDSYTGSVPNFGFGMGKVNGLEVLKYSNFQPTITGTAYFCAGDSTLLESTIHDSLVWFNNIISPFNYIDSAETVWVEAYNSQGCKGISDTLIVFEAPSPQAPIITHLSNGLTSSPAFTYQWYFNGNTLTSEDGQQHIAQNSGYYQVQISNQYGCTTLSDSIFISLVDVEDFEEIILVYPNPADSYVHVEGAGQFDINLFDGAGKEIKNLTISNDGRLQIGHLANGIYTLTVNKDDRMWTYRLVKQ